jgi:hypothetical protein
MQGKKMFGEWALVRIHGRGPKGNEWLLLKHRDEFANEQIDVTVVAPRSVVSNRTVEEVSAENVWISNRSAKPRGTTVQARLEREDAEKKRAKPAAKRAPRKSTKAAPAKAAPTKRRTATSASKPAVRTVNAKPVATRSSKAATTDSSATKPRRKS